MQSLSPRHMGGGKAANATRSTSARLTATSASRIKPADTYDEAIGRNSPLASVARLTTTMASIAKRKPGIIS